jgi:hypothetical protein
MKTSGAGLSLLLALISGSSCYAARPVRHGISPAALAAVRPVFVPWKRCNAAISQVAAHALTASSTSTTNPYGDVDAKHISQYCGQAYQVVVTIKLKGRLAHNAYMTDAGMTWIIRPDPVGVE